MPTVALDAALTRRLRKAVTNPLGQALLREGMDLTPDVVARLRTLGVAYVEVEPLPGEASDVPSVEEALAALDARFADHTRSSLMMGIKAAVAQHIKDEAARLG